MDAITILFIAVQKEELLQEVEEALRLESICWNLLVAQFIDLLA